VDGHLSVCCLRGLRVELLESLPDHLEEYWLERLDACKTAEDIDLSLSERLVLIEPSCRPVIRIGSVSTHLDKPIWELESR